MADYIVKDGVVIDPCTCEPVAPQMEKIKVEQIVAAGSAQRVLEITLNVPLEKPPIGQVVKHVVKNLEVTDVKVIPNKVIITGTLEVKVMYVAQLPDQPVHAVEIKEFKWTRDIALEGVNKDMKAKGDVVLEYSNYEFECEEKDAPPDCNRREVKVIIVIKAWAKVFDYVEMEVLAQPLVVEGEDGKKEIISASDFEDEVISANELVESMEPVKVEPVTPGKEVVTVTGTATVTGSNVNVRSGPGVTFPVVAKVNKGAKVTLREQAFGWYRVTLADGTDGWIAGWLLKRD